MVLLQYFESSCMKKNVSFCESLCENNGTWTSLSERVSLIKLIVVVGGGLKLICFYIFYGKNEGQKRKRAFKRITAEVEKEKKE